MESNNFNLRLCFNIGIMRYCAKYVASNDSVNPISTRCPNFSLTLNVFVNLSWRKSQKSHSQVCYLSTHADWSVCSRELWLFVCLLFETCAVWNVLLNNSVYLWYIYGDRGKHVCEQLFATVNCKVCIPFFLSIF